MKSLLLILVLSLFSIQSFASSCPDGSEPVKSISEDGTYFVFNCGGGNKQASSSSADSSSANSSNVNSNTKALAGIDIENDPNVDFFLPPKSPPPNIFGRTYGGRWRVLDMNNDGISDVVYVFSMNSMPDKAIGKTTAGACGGPACEGFKPQPSLYLGAPDGKLHFSPELIIDNRKEPGISGGGQQLFADFNGDKVLDIYIGDHGLGTHDGHRDSYYLSQPNGTWVESSETHLSHSNFKVFNHGDATGDIDNDGDMDVVITDLKGHFWCLVNDGSGLLTKRMCGGVFAFALELADMDSDGDLDALVGAHEHDSNNSLTGVVWNDGQGNFAAYNTTSFKQYKSKWGTVPEVSAADLDGDGDLDVVYSRAGDLYVGTAVQIIENLGNKKFKDHGIISIVEAPADYIPNHEGNEWNHFIQVIHFRDIDNDGDQDIFLQTRKDLNRGGLLINNGGFSFDYISPPKAIDYYKKLDNSSIVISNEVLKSRAKVKETKYSKKFESSIKKHGKVTFEGASQFVKLDIAVPLNTSGALLVGFSKLKQLTKDRLMFRSHIKYGAIDFSVGTCVTYYPKNKFTGVETTFNKDDWGGLHTYYPIKFSGCKGHWGVNDNDKSLLQELGIHKVMVDMNNQVFDVQRAIHKNSKADGELSLITDIEKEKAERIAELKKKQEEEKAKRLAKERENKKNNFKYSSRNFKTQLNLLSTQFSQVCDNVLREFNSGDYKGRTKKNTYFFVTRDSNGKDCHYEWASNEGNALRRCKQNNETDGKCTIYALGDNIVWGNPTLYKELTGRK